jgi:hypothetical protein
VLEVVQELVMTGMELVVLVAEEMVVTLTAHWQ